MSQSVFAAKPTVQVTYIGTATMLLEIGDKNPIRILTDPVFDPPGKKYFFALGQSSIKTEGPAIDISALPPIDLVLLSHDEHADNLDDSGRALLSTAKQVITTESGAERLKAQLGNKVVGLDPYSKNKKKFKVTSPEGWVLTVTSAPAQHAPLCLLTCVTGDVIGFVLEWPGQEQGVTYITGDTIFFKDIKNIPKEFPKVENLFIHLGGVQFGITGKWLYTMNGKHASQFIKTVRPKRVIPIHFDGWTHFHETLAESKKNFEPVVQSLGSELQLLDPGLKTKLENP